MNARVARLLSLLAMIVLGFACGGDQYPSPPPTAKRPVTDGYYGTKVVDDYRWLDNLKDTEVRKWNDAQNAYTRSVLDRFPSWEALHNRLKNDLTQTGASYSELTYRRKLFAMKRQPPRNQAFLVVIPANFDTSTEKVVVDPNVLYPGGTTSIDWFVPSRDGRLVAVSLSERGSEQGTASIFDTETGRKLDDVIPRVQYATGSGSVEWNAGNTGFYYTRYPWENERLKEDEGFYQQVYFHRLGKPASSDAYRIGKEFSRIAEVRLSSTGDGRFLLATVANGDGGDFEHYIMGPGGKWMRLTTYADQIKATAFGPDGTLYMLSRKDAPRGRILAVRFPGGRPAKPVPVVAEGDWSIIGLLPTQSRLYVEQILGGPERIAAFDLKGDLVEILPADSIASVGGMVAVGADDVLYTEETYTTPRAFFRYEAAARKSEKLPLSEMARVDMSDIEVSRESAVSKDGTRVPMNILRKKGTPLDGSNPTILYGYGGYGISEIPAYQGSKRFWFDNGGIFVTTNLRGGAEFGEEWHESGRLTKKQNVFDDFAACAQWLIDRKYTGPSHLLIQGGSNGGLLMGAELTQHPELFRAVVSTVGVYDMLRVELFPNGAFNVTELGTVRDPDQFKALYAYSPYHHVVDGTKYPAVLFMTGDNDGRVDPANSRKMTARLQAATVSGLPILLRTDSNAGHGFGTGLNDYISAQADLFTFVFQQLGMEYH